MLGKEEFLCTRQNKITSKTLGVILLVGNVRKKNYQLPMIIRNQAFI